MPVGARAILEHDVVFLLEAYNQPYRDIMSMPSSRRHRLVKIREEIVRQRRHGGSGGGRSATYHTGIEAPKSVTLPPTPPTPSPAWGA